MNKYFASKKKEVSLREKRHALLARQAAAEGIVLLENRKGLPLSEGVRVALFGDGARETLICGLGAASMNYRHAVTIEDGLRNAGFEITTTAYLEKASAKMNQKKDAYFGWLREVSNGSLLQGVFAMYSNPFISSVQELILQEDIQKPTETAIYVISRNSGEGADRKNIPGDYQLSEDERQNLAFLDANFHSVIVLLNTVGVIDTKFIREMKHLKALLFVGLGGIEAGNAVADVLLGKIAPQGKLTSTWAQNYEDYPNALNFAENNGNLDDELYSEGIYVGYRYFDSFRVKAAYPFGYGLTYADFSITMMGIEQKRDKIITRVNIRNTSLEHSGREVVQLYVSAPEGRISKPYQCLAGYAKSSRLDPGQEEVLEIELDSKSFASYHEQEQAWILEAGEYLVRLGNSSVNTRPVGVIRLQDQLILEKCRNLFLLDTEMEEWSVVTDQLSDEINQVYPEHVLELDQSQFETKIHTYRSVEKAGVTPAATGNMTFTDVMDGSAGIQDFVSQLSVEEMALICVGNVSDEQTDVNRASVMAAGTAIRRNAEQDNYENHIVPGSSETTGALQAVRRIPKLNLADGGSGLRLVSEFETDKESTLLTSGLFSIYGVDRIAEKKSGYRQFEDSELYYQFTTALPMAVILAQSWDVDLLQQCGEMVGRELVEFGVDLWLAPSMNIHRNPLCGRNFEYYSEDPLVTGISGSAMVRGVEQFRGVGSCIKHLACNNQEANRGATNAHVSERALREIYLRGFEKAIRQESPMCIMTSLNLINGVHAANSYDLLTSFIRDECRFDGFVMTDWGTTVSDPDEHNKYPCSSVEGCLKAGNDLIMPGTKGDIEGIKKAVEEGSLGLWQLRECTARILKIMNRLHRSI